MKSIKNMKMALMALFAVNSVILCLALWKALTTGEPELMPNTLTEEEEISMATAFEVQETSTPDNASPLKVPTVAREIPVEDTRVEVRTLDADDSEADKNRMNKEKTVALVQPVVKPEEKEQHCWMLGAFANKSTAKRIEETLLPKSDAIQLLDYSTQTIKSYWVHLPRFASRQAAVKRHQVLKQQKIDSFVIKSGERTNAISLGIFSTEVRAKRLQTMLRKKGVKAQIKPNLQINPQFWLQIHGIPKGEWPQLQPLVVTVVKAAQKKAQKMIQKPCKAIASFS